MKILLFFIFPIVMILAFTVQDVKAMPYASPQDLYKQSDMVIYGQVTAKENGPGPDYYNYQVKVLTYFKNPQVADSITIAGHKPDNATGLISYPQFEVGDRAIFYVNNLNGINTISPYSVKAGGACNINSFLGSNGISGHLIIGPVPGNHIYIEDVNGKIPYLPLTFHTVVFHDDDVWNNYPEPRPVPVTLSIVNEEGEKQVFNQTQNVEIPACGGPGKVQWNFVPMQVSNYVATVTDYKYKVKMGFNTVSDSTNSIFPSPLEQTRLGVQPDNVNCSDGLWLLIKAEDGSPACVGPSTAKQLIERGWARQGTYYQDIHVQPEITLNDYNYPGIDQDSNTTVSINNQTYYQTTLNYSAYKLPPATPIQFHNVTFTFPAGTFLTPGGAIIMLDIRFPDGYAETYGNHTANGGSGILVPSPYGPHLAVNSTTILSNHMRPQAGMTIYHDKIKLLVSVDNFARTISTSQTSPNKLEIDLANQTYEAGYPVDVNLRNVNQDYGCRIPSVSVIDESNQSIVFGPTPVRYYGNSHCADPWNVTFYAGLENNSLVTKPTRYEIVATLDNMTYQKEFTAVPSNYSGINISSGSFQVRPGFLTYSSCLPIPSMPPNNGTLVSYSGFGLYHRYLAGSDTGGLEFNDYLLRPGERGSFVMQVHQGQFLPGHNLAGGLSFLSGNLLNVDNSTVWKSDMQVASEDHPGLDISYSPSFAVAGLDGYATITVSISARQDAPTGSYWLYLPPGECGGRRVLLTVGNTPLAQPPDYIGYDFDSSFVVDSAGNLVFEIINPGIHTFENCSLNYVSNNQTTTIKTFRVIDPGMEFKHVWNTTSYQIDKRFLQCTTPPITKIYPNEVIDGLPW